MSQQPISVLGMHLSFATIAAPTVFTEIEECTGIPEFDDAFGEKEYMTISDTRKQKGTKSKEAVSFSIQVNRQKATNVPGQEALKALKGEEVWLKVHDDAGEMDTLYAKVRFFGIKKNSANADDDLTDTFNFAQLSDTTTTAPV